MAAFDKAFDLTDEHEGGFVNDPADKGGMTYHGISRRHHPTWPGWSTIDLGVVDSMALRLQVWEFYKNNYWRPLGLDDILAQPLANVMYDTGVLFGLSRAGRFLQRALNALNTGSEEFWPPVAEDGIIGQKTIAAANAAVGRVPELVFLIAAQRAMHHLGVVDADPSQKRFMFGWIRRAKTFVR